MIATPPDITSYWRFIMKEIKLIGSILVALVDDEDYERVNQFTWHVRNNPLTNYCRRVDTHEAGGLVYMHRFILGLTDPKVHVDHINSNGLDNRQCNIRAVTRSQNHMNMRKKRYNGGRPTSSKFKGVHWCNTAKRWVSRIVLNGKVIRTKHFRDEISAAKAYNDAAQKYFGEFARLNKITEAK